MTHEVRFAAGSLELAGEVTVPRGAHASAIVFVHGSGPATRADWQEEAAWFASRGVASLTYDKPGCGESTGDWTAQSFDDRADEALIALRFLGKQPDVHRDRVGLIGMSQGGWIAPMAAAMSEEVKFIVVASASGVGPREQDRYRVEHQLRSDGFSQAEIEEALVAWRDRDERLRSNDSVEAVLAAARAFQDRRWYPYLAFDEPNVLRFVRRLWNFDPTPYLERCRCPMLAIWGEEDVLVSSAASRENFDRALTEAGNPDFELVVIPGADHGLRLSGNDERVLSALELIADWIKSRTGDHQVDRPSAGVSDGT
jgi:pimeloyl-ACP methyl ester carboxylesterase